ncbi:fimbrial protein [Pantoea sp.]|uniref:fimbrial protein n=1 Tax=Pantoea sp. TaxID=69393 RepID=UPI0031D4757A
MRSSLFFILAFGLFNLGSLWCNVSEATPNLLFRGIIIDPPACKINNDTQINVIFGDELGVGKIDGIHYRQKIAYQIQCSVDMPPSRLKLTITGNIMSSDFSAIQTSKPGLGIRLLLDNQRVNIGNSIIIDPTKPPIFEAVPVANPGIRLSEGSFEAIASIIAEYN